MNTVWSQFIQGENTLYYSRKLRFCDVFAERYRSLLKLDGRRRLKILEVGCGPGALAGALHRWYPKAEICGLDRDSNFIEFARAHEEGVEFVEGDATALPFADGTFDVTISYTVSEHIEPEKFFGEQLRVLKSGGVCIVLSNRKTFEVKAPCLAESEFEEQFWRGTAERDGSLDKYAVRKYPLTEAELPAAMEKYGFGDITCDYLAIGLTPDDKKFAAIARDIIEEGRNSELDGLGSAARSLPDFVTAEDVQRMTELINKKYDERLAQYGRGEKQWDTAISLIMVLRGIKN